MDIFLSVLSMASVWNDWRLAVITYTKVSNIYIYMYIYSYMQYNSFNFKFKD